MCALQASVAISSEFVLLFIFFLPLLLFLSVWVRVRAEGLTDPAWRLATPSRALDDVEDAQHHEGRFYSITCSGAVEVWDRHAKTDEFVSVPVEPRLSGGEGVHLSCKCIAVAPDGRLLAVLKYSKEDEEHDGYQYQTDKIMQVSFKVQVVDVAHERWEETKDIGDLALFISVNTSLCMPARERLRIRADCVYYTEGELRQTSERLNVERYEASYRSSIIDGCNDELRDLGVYVLKDSTVERVFFR